jgi:hypothetical protein
VFGPRQGRGSKRRFGCGRRHRRRNGGRSTVRGAGQGRRGCREDLRSRGSGPTVKPAWPRGARCSGRTGVAEGRPSALWTGRRLMRRLPVASRNGDRNPESSARRRREGPGRRGLAGLTQNAPCHSGTRPAMIGCLRRAPSGRTPCAGPTAPRPPAGSRSAARALVRGGSSTGPASLRPAWSGWPLSAIEAVCHATRTPSQRAARPLPQSGPGRPPTRPIPLSSSPVTAGARPTNRSSSGVQRRKAVPSIRSDGRAAEYPAALVGAGPAPRPPVRPPLRDGRCAQVADSAARHRDGEREQGARAAGSEPGRPLRGRAEPPRWPPRQPPDAHSSGGGRRVQPRHTRCYSQGRQAEPGALDLRLFG